MPKPMSFVEAQKKLSESKWFRADKRMDIADARNWVELARILHPFHSVGIPAADFCRGMALIAELAGNPRGKKRKVGMI
jgi:hypothetical protein